MKGVICVLSIVIITLNYSYSQVNDSTDTGTFIDSRDNQVYKWVRIGNQVWMIENLKTTKYHDETSIPNVTDSTAWNNLTTGAYSDYDNTPSNSDTYGRLYNWYAVNTGKLCPDGWHVSNDAEWTILTDYLGGFNIVGGKLKETGTTHWESPNAGATNESGFTALPGGFRGRNGEFYDIGINGLWWSSTKSINYNPRTYYMTFMFNYVRGFYRGKTDGFSVRCVKDQ